MIVCIQCALKALVEDRPYLGSPEDATPDEHRLRVHPDPAATLRERVELERLAAHKLLQDGLSSDDSVKSHT